MVGSLERALYILRLFRPLQKKTRPEPSLDRPHFNALNCGQSLRHSNLFPCAPATAKSHELAYTAVFTMTPNPHAKTIRKAISIATPICHGPSPSIHAMIPTTTAHKEPHFTEALVAP
jgi:hypothetical protein